MFTGQKSSFVDLGVNFRNSEQKSSQELIAVKIWIPSVLALRYSVACGTLDCPTSLTSPTGMVEELELARRRTPSSEK